MKQSAKKILSITLTAVLLFCSFQAPIPSFGPRLSDAATELVATQIDLEELEPIFPSDAEPIATSTTRLTNVLVTIAIAKDNVKNLSFYVNNTANASLFFYDTSVNGNISYTDEVSETQLDVSYSPNGADDKNTDIIRLMYSSPLSYSEAKAAISVVSDGGWYVDSNPIPITDSDAFSVSYVYLGDVDQNGAVNATDSSLALRAYAGQYTMTYTQMLAADVNYNGIVNADDVRAIQAYYSEDFTNFWGDGSIIPITVPETAPVTDGKVYRVKNNAAGKYLTSTETTTVCGVNTWRSGNTQYSTNLKLSYNTSGLMVLRSEVNNMYLGVNSSGVLYYTPSVSDSTIFWYVVPAENGYHLVNRAYPNKLLGQNGFGRDLGSSVWSFEQRIITLKYRYDFAYQYRLYGTGSTAAAAVKTDLNAKQEQIQDILLKLFDFDTTLDTAARFCSRADLCYAPNSSPTASQMMNALNTTVIGDNQAAAGAESTPCTHCNDTTCYTGSTDATTHHRSASQGLTYYHSKKVDPDPAIWVLFSGYDPCHVWDPDKDGNTQHEYNTIAGLAQFSSMVAGVYHSDSNDSWLANDQNSRIYRDTVNALHEISHCLGAIKSETCDADENHGNCVMSYNAAYATLYGWFNSGSTTQYSNLYCDGCFDAVDQFIKYY